MSPSPPHLQLFDVLEPDEHRQLLDHVADLMDTLQPSSVVHPGTEQGERDGSFRKSSVAPDLEPIWPLFEARLKALLPHVRREIGVSRFDLGSIERQLTVHRDGDFFSQHVDENHPGTNGSRMVTFVFYFNTEPRQFRGGTLRLYDSEDRGGVLEPLDTYTEIEPVPNSIVFFPAGTSHEVTPVVAEGDGPGSLRWTVNGWFRAGHTGREALPQPDRRARIVLQERIVPRVAPAPFTVRPTPAAVHDLLTALFELRSAQGHPETADVEHFPDGGPEHVPVGHLGDEVLRRLLPLHEAWAGTDLEPSGAYGLRVFKEGQTLAMKVDRPGTHVITSVLSVHQDLDRPWPLTLRADGRRHDVHLDEGHMLLYESASIPHGRLTPMPGREYAVLLLHYRPRDWGHDLDSVVKEGLARGIIDGAGRLIPDPIDR